ncbi:hypothetical protein [Haladaptatus salinisoli]|uniref:hypothetical protein n=1 Tax=Haladaptatus salinisoli TaxID=2884876 RepID=UPI001D0B0D64|nr:hypothetical protein [Haladaptatus salinisoli]
MTLDPVDVDLTGGRLCGGMERSNSAAGAALADRPRLTLVAGALVVGAGYRRRSLAASLVLGASPLLADMTAYLVRDALAGAPLSPGRVLFLYSRTPYALVGAGALYLLGYGSSRIRRGSETDRTATASTEKRLREDGS